MGRSGRGQVGVAPGIVVRLSPVIAGLLDAPAQALTVPVAHGETATVDAVLRHLDERAPGALLEPRSGQLRRHIQVYVNRRLATERGRAVTAGDVVEIDLRMLEGG